MASEIPTGLRENLADRYALERLIARGGMASVYLGRDLKHDRAVAVKVLRPELGALLGSIPVALERSSPYLTHPVFHRHRSETALLRYLRPAALGDTAGCLGAGLLAWDLLSTEVSA